MSEITEKDSQTLEGRTKYMLDQTQFILKRIADKKEDDGYRKVNQDIIKLSPSLFKIMDEYFLYYPKYLHIHSFGQFKFSIDQLLEIKKMFLKVKEFEEIFKNKDDEETRKSVLEKLVYDLDLKFE